MRALLYPLRIVAYFFSLLPFPVIYLIADLLYLVLYRIAGYRKQVVQDNLARAFPEKTASERVAIEQAYYRNLCDIIVEFLKLPSMSSSSLRKRVRFTNPEVLQNLTASGTGAIGITSHMCNWEWGGLALSEQVKGMACLGVYKPLTNQLFDTWFRQLRGRFGMIMVPMKNTYRALKTDHGKPVLLNLIADQTPTLSETEWEAPFLGISTPVFLGPEKIARSTGMPVVYFAMRRTGRGMYAVETIPIPPAVNPSADGHDLTRAHLHLLEQEIFRHPSDWLWSHRRWKHSGKTLKRSEQSDKL